MVALLLALLSLAPALQPAPSVAPADSVHVLYANKNADALHRLYADAPNRATALLCRYRLYPLTEDDALLDDLPDDLPHGTAREYALLSGLWGYRAARAPIHRAVGYGLRSERLLEAAKALAPDDPYVLLIEGQSLLFKPSIWGGDKEAALGRFRRLRAVSPAARDFDAVEADLWIWYTLDALGDPAAGALRRRLLARALPPLYREFLNGRIG